MNTKQVATTAELVAASEDATLTHIEVVTTLGDVPSIKLAPGQTLSGSAGSQKTLVFLPGVDGVGLTSGNTVHTLHLNASPGNRVVWNDTSVATLGTLTLKNISAVGQMQILARDQVRAGHVEVSGVDIVAADTRAAMERPNAYGVSVLQGAFTLWNMQPEESVVITANLLGLSAGRAGAPVLGGGIFVSGAGDGAGRLRVQQLETGAVFSHGMIPPGTPDVISGGVFTVYGCQANVVRNRGPVTTYGPNDMALDNWGSVDRWIASETVTTHGPSGIGFVNFGTLGLLRLEAPIETFGQGSRGFNVYTGTVALADFDRIVTHGDGAVGVQIAQPVGELVFRRGIETFGATGPSLVKGVVQNLSAVAMSIKPGGSAKKISISGGLRTNSRDIAPLEQLGSIESLVIHGGFAGETNR